MRKSEDPLRKKWKIQNLTLRTQLRLWKFLTFIRFLRKVSDFKVVLKNFMSDMITSKVFKSLPEIRALQCTSNHDHTMRKSEAAFSE
eukprot:UN15313